MTMPESYNSKEPPTKRDRNWRMEVFIEVDVTSISHIKEINLSMLTRFQLHLFWRDHRLTFHNLKPDYMQNLINKNVASDLWIPPLTIESAEDEKKKNLKYDSHTTMAVMRESDADPSKVDTLHETQSYPGAANTLVLVRNYDMVQRCDFKLNNYPFDNQHCFINVRFNMEYIMWNS